MRPLTRLDPGGVAAPRVDGSAGHRLQFPDSTAYTITQTTSETGGAAVELEVALVPAAQTPPPHLHPHQTEAFEVLDGSFELWLDGKWRRLGTGERATALRGQRHTFRSSSASAARVRMMISPALSFEEYIRRVHALLAGGKLRGPKDPLGLVYLSMLFAEHRDTVAAASSGQRMVMALLGSIGKALRLQLPPREIRSGG